MLHRYYQCFLTLLLLVAVNVVYADTVSDLFHNPNDPVAGNPKGSITVVEFFDYQCMHCANMAPILDAIIHSNSNVRIVFKELPIRGPISEFAARAALAAAKQGKYYQLNHALFTTERDLTEASILDIAKEQGLNISQLKQDMNSKSVQKIIQDNVAFANFLGIPGTPAIFIGKTDATSVSTIQFVPGEIGQQDLQSAIASASQT